MTDNVVSVTEALRRRRDRGGVSPFNDGRRIALVAEGGAMRGVVAGGMVSAIERLGLTTSFDLMVGSSAGACALTYLRAGQARYGTRIFSEDINNNLFIDPKRALRGKPIVDIDFLVDEVFAKIKPLNAEALCEPGAKLYATVSDVNQGTSVLLDGFDDQRRALENLRATAKMPLLSGRAVRVDGVRYLDGGLLSHIPVEAAKTLGATDIVVILTKPEDRFAHGEESFAKRALTPALLSMIYSRKLAMAAWREANWRPELHRRLLAGSGVMAPGRIASTAPSAAFGEVSRMEKDASRLINAARDADAQMTALLER